MKVVVLQYKFQNDGSTNALLKLFKSLSEKGIEFLVIFSRGGSKQSVLQELGIKAVRVPFLMSSDRGYKGLIRYAYIILCILINSIALLSMFAISLKYKPNIIHTNVSPIHLGYYLAKLLNLPHVWHLREFRRKEQRAQPILNYTYFKKLLYSSDTIATTKSIKEYYGLQRCRVIYDGVIDNHMKSSLNPLKERKNAFLFVGRVEQSKGIELLINSFAKFSRANKDWFLDIVGGYDEKYYEKLSAMIKALEMEDRVCFLGICDDVKEKMAERKVVVISSLSEGFGYVTVEAMANKCFVIGNNNTGTREQLDNAKQLVGLDIAYRFTDENELLLQMNKFVYGDYEYHQNMVDAAYEVVNKLYGVDKYSSEVLSYYKLLI